MKRVVSILSLVLIVGACHQRNDAAPEQTAASAVAKSGTLTPEQLGALGAEIRKEPGRGDELLRQHGLTRETFEKAIRDITESTEASRRYAEAYRRASA